LSAKYSTITGNQIDDSGGTGGGAFVQGGTVFIVGSTIDNNAGGAGSALSLVMTDAGIVNSTISHNHGPALGISLAHDVILANTTIAYNDGSLYVGGSGVYAHDAQSLTVQSCIVAKNIGGDFYSAPSVPLSGTDNLIMTINVASLPQDFVTETRDPQLGPLQLNGGRTKSHALLRGSPAIAHGNNAEAMNFDQRGPGYPRATVSGGNQTIDMGAYEYDSIFADGLGIP